MKKITVKDVIEICNGKLICGDEKEIIENFSINTQKIDDGDFFVALKGENYDGNEFIEEAFKSGANGCIIQKEIKEEIIIKYKNKTIIFVNNTIEALQKLATYKRSIYDIPVIAVTGSVGKTSTKDLIASVLKQKYNVLKTEGNMNNHIGLPYTILKLKEHDCLVVEMGMNHFGEISVLTNIAKPTLCILTNIGTSHIGLLGSRQNILKAKLEILEGLKENGTIVINNDNDLLHEWRKSNKNLNICTYGIKDKSDFMAYNIIQNKDGMEYNIKVADKEYNVFVPVHGEHFVLNSLCAIAVGTNYNISIEKILEGIQKLELTKKRMEIKKLADNIIVIDDSYNASYDSVKPALEYLSNINKRRKVAILGDMFELGEYTKEMHQKVGEEVFKNKIDVLITVGEFSKEIKLEAIEMGMLEENIYWFATTDEAKENISKIVKENDTILIKASNAMQFNKIAEKLYERGIINE